MSLENNDDNPPPTTYHQSTQQTPTQLNPLLVPSTIKAALFSKRGEYDIWCLMKDWDSIWLAHTNDPILGDLVEMMNPKRCRIHLEATQFEGFHCTPSQMDGIHKGMRDFTSLLCQLEIHWKQFLLILRSEQTGKLGQSQFDDLYNNLRVFESGCKRALTASSSNLQNVDLVSEKPPAVLMMFSTALWCFQITGGWMGWNPGNNGLQMGAELGKKGKESKAFGLN
ncbi:hypothetical protein Tco_0637281 [Tanacetum coccineum]